MKLVNSTYREYSQESGVLSFEIRFNINNSNETYSIYPADCVEGTFKLTDAICPPGEFSLGNAISKKIEVDLITGLDETLDLDFTQVFLYFGIPDENGEPTNKWFYDSFVVEKKFLYGKQMNITGYDYLGDASLNSATINGYDFSGKTIGGILTDLQIPYNSLFYVDTTWTFPSITVNGEYGIQNMTKRDVLAKLAGFFGTNVRTEGGRYVTFVPLPNLADYGGTDPIVGIAIVGSSVLGDTTYTFVSPHMIMEPPQVYSEPISVSGVFVQAVDGSTYSPAPGSVNPDDFIMTMTSNPFVRNETDMTKCAHSIYAKTVGRGYSQFSLSVIGNPMWEAGDAIIFDDDNGHVIKSVITSFEYVLGGLSTISCIVEEASTYNTVEQIMAQEGDNTSVISKGETTTSMPFFGYGYISSSQTVLRLMIPFCKPIAAPSFTITSIDGCYLRWNGGYVYYNSGSARTAISGVTLLYDDIEATIYPQQGILVSATCTNKWYQTTSTAITNNSIVTANGTITGTFS